MTLTGSCSCGAVTATIEGEAIAVRQCWCRDCQKLSGGGATHNAMFPASALTLSGITATHSVTADSGNTLTQHFCAQCGTPVYATSSARMQFRTMRIGFLNAGHGLRPSMAIWTDSAPEWAVIDPALERHAKQPPAPAAPPA